MTDWESTFEAIDLCIESKDFEEARNLIDHAIWKANHVLIDPTFLVKQLNKQKEMVESQITRD